MLRNILLGLLLLGTPATSFADDSAIAQASSQKSDMVKVEMMVVHATTKHTKVDSRLKNIKKYFKNYNFTGYSLLKKKGALIPDKGLRHFVIDGSRKVQVRLINHTPKKARLQIQITGKKNRKLLDTTVVVKRNSTFIVAGPKYDKGILILPLAVKY